MYVNMRRGSARSKGLHSLVRHHLTAGVAAPPLPITLDVITEAEEAALAAQADSWFAGKPYEMGHFDGVAARYRELQRPAKRFSRPNRAVIDRLSRETLPAGASLMPIHLLDLDAEGEIGRHVDHVEYSGAYIVGLSLLSDAVMVLHHEHSTSSVELLLPRRSVYVLTAAARYEWAHALPARPTFGGREVQKTRRLSVLLRDSAPPDAPSTPSHAESGGRRADGAGGAPPQEPSAGRADSPSSSGTRTY